MMRAVLLWAFLLLIASAVTDPAAVALAGESAAREGAEHGQELKGAHWSARKASGVYIVSVQSGSSLLEALTDFAKSQGIQGGQITGIGGASEATLRFYDPATRRYADKTFPEQMEITNLAGNISDVLGVTTLHMHITLGRRDYTALAGHLLDAKISGAGEFFIYPIDARIAKVKDENLGLNFYDFGR